MLVNKANLDLAFRGFKAAFADGFTAMAAASQWRDVAMEVPSATSEELYGWLKDIPGLRKWVGDRVVHNLSAGNYTLRNEDFEDTVAIDTNSLNDDRVGLYGPRMRIMGDAYARFEDTQVFSTLAAGFAAACWDGQYFFDTDHPVLDATGAMVSVANTDGGSGTAWYLLALDSPLKPLINQVRQRGAFEQLTPDEVVKRDRKIEYGVHHRAAFGYGFWQCAWGSKQTLDATHYETALAALQAFKRDYGQPYGFNRFALLVPPSLRSAATKLVKLDRTDAGAGNPNFETAELRVIPWLA